MKKAEIGKRFVVYYRVSTDKQDYRSQRHEVENYCRLHNIKPVEVFREKVSGAAKRRPMYNKVMELAFRKRIDGIIVYKLDRFGRNSGETIRAMLELDQWGVQFICVDNPAINLQDENNPFRRAFAAMFADLADVERQNIVSRIKAGLEAAKKRGVQLGRPAIYSKKIHQTIHMLRAEGTTIRQIADVLDISKSTVGRVLKAG